MDKIIRIGMDKRWCIGRGKNRREHEELCGNQAAAELLPVS